MFLNYLHIYRHLDDSVSRLSARSSYFTLISDTLVAYHSRDKNPPSANYVTKENRVTGERNSKFISRYSTITVVDLKGNRRRREKEERK